MKVFISPFAEAMLTWLGPIGVLFIALGSASAAMVVAQARKGNARGVRVRILAVPPGEAPRWVREKWVGLELPLARFSAGARPWRSAGVLTGPRGFLAMAGRLFRGGLPRQSGFVVNVLEAVAVLELASPEAAQWWRTNAAHLMKPSRHFLFPENVCEVVQ